MGDNWYICLDSDYDEFCFWFFNCEYKHTEEYILLKFTFFPSVVFFLEGGVEVLPCSRGNFPEQGSNLCLLLWSAES